ncbi:MAG: ABC transporter permease, partial [Symbiopectobacterium sp.]
IRIAALVAWDITLDPNLGSAISVLLVLLMALQQT